MKHLENFEVLIQSDENHPEILLFTWKVESTHQQELINYANLLIDIAGEHGYQYVLFNSKNLRNVVQDDVMALFQWSMQWYKKMKSAGVKKVGYIVNKRSQFDEEKDGIKLNDLLTIEEAYDWLLDKKSSSVNLDSKIQKFATLSRKSREDQIVSIDFESDTRLCCMNQPAAPADSCNKASFFIRIKVWKEKFEMVPGCYPRLSS